MDADPDYDLITFNNAIISGSKLFVQGNFNYLNGKKRDKFAFINMSNGQVESIDPSFLKPNSYAGMYFNSYKLVGKNIWFGYYNYSLKRDGFFSGLGAIDTLTGVLLPDVFKVHPIKDSTDGLWGNVHSFEFSNDTLFMAGIFGDRPRNRLKNLAKVKLLPSSVPTTTGALISGNNALLANSSDNRYYVQNSNTSLYSYYWEYSGTGVEILTNGSDTVSLKVSTSATPGTLTVRSVNHCGYGPVLSKALTIFVPALPDFKVELATPFPVTYTSGYPVNLSLVVKNQGTGASPSFKLAYYYSRDSIFTPFDQILTHSTIPGIAANSQTNVITESISLPCTEQLGDFYILVVADSLNLVTELNETNNRIMIKSQIIAGPTFPTPQISISPASDVCFPQTVTLTITSNDCPNCTYIWSNGTTGKVNTITGPISAPINLTARLGCVEYLTSRPINIYPVSAPSIPTYNFPVLQVSQTGLFFTTTYQWYRNGVLIPGATGHFYIPNQNGNYSYTYTNAQCTSAPSAAMNVVLTSIIDVNTGARIEIFPNPAINRVFLNGLKQNEKYRIYLVNSTGSNVSEISVYNSKDAFLEVSNLASGVYFIKIHSESSKREIGVQKIIISR